MSEEASKEFNEFKGFYINGQPVVDEICMCGHKQSQHSNTSVFLGYERSERLPQYHGRCLVGGCQCPKYVWKGWVLANGDVSDFDFRTIFFPTTE